MLFETHRPLQVYSALECQSAPASEWDLSAEFDKRIRGGPWVLDSDQWSQLRAPGGSTMAGFTDLETKLQYQLLKDASHETAMLLGLIVDWGGTGATNSGIGTSYSRLTPTYYFGLARLACIGLLLASRERRYASGNGLDQCLVPRERGSRAGRYGLRPPPSEQGRAFSCHGNDRADQ